MNSIDIRHGDCLEVLRSLPDNSVDSVATDPPYGLSNTKPAQVADVLAAWVTGDTEAVPAKKGGFMGKDWDSFVPPPAVWAECLRVLKPGGHMAVFAGARTQDLMGLSIRLAGFEIRDTLGWVYSQGFPKSMDVSKAIESTLTTGKSNSRSLRKTEQDGDGAAYTLTGKNNGIMGETRTYERKQFTPASDAAKQWSGWGTALKPAIEPIILARKPLDGTVAANVLAHGVGGLNIDASRVPTEDKLGGGHSTNGQQMQYGWHRPWMDDPEAVAANAARSRESVAKSEELGRFPANVLLDEHAAAEMDEQSGVSVSNVRRNVERDYTNAKSLTPDSGKGGGSWSQRFWRRVAFLPSVQVSGESAEEGTPRDRPGGRDEDRAPNRETRRTHVLVGHSHHP
ncbi:DNA methyltransferase [Corynebacterium kalidii]